MIVSAERYAPPDAPTLDASLPDAVANALRVLCLRPEYSLAATGVTLAMGNVPSLFVSNGLRVTLSPAACALDVLPGVLRHALELAGCQQRIPDPGTLVVSLALGVLSARYAAVADVSVPSPHRDLLAWARADLPAWNALPPGIAARLLALQTRVLTLDPPWEHVRAVVDPAWSLAVPVEYLLTTGGDSRLRVDPATGLNHYGCSPRPRPSAITFASCTATSISSPAYAAAETLRRRMLCAVVLGDASAPSREVRFVRRAIAENHGLDSADQVILASSGTDAELIALHLSLCAHDAPLRNVVVGPGETGSNVGVAAAGRHFDAATALGTAVPRGELLAGLPPGRVLVAPTLPTVLALRARWPPAGFSRRARPRRPVLSHRSARGSRGGSRRSRGVAGVRRCPAGVRHRLGSRPRSHGNRTSRSGDLRRTHHL